MTRWRFRNVLWLLILLLAACSSLLDRPDLSSTRPTSELLPKPEPTVSSQIEPTIAANEEGETDRLATTLERVASGQIANVASANCDNPIPEERRFPPRPWPNTNFCLHSVSYDEIQFGGVPKDRIPSIDEPVFHTIMQAAEWLAGIEPVVALEFEKDVRAYPLQVLVWHEIVNDIVAGRPLLITYCPLCNSALVFDREIEGNVLDFGTSGNIRNADLIMYDRQTESWWQQFTGEAIVGQMTGHLLTLLPSSIVSFDEFRAQFPDGKVLFPDTGFERRYGETPYISYDSQVNPGTKFYDGEPDDRLHPKMRVMAVTIDEKAIAYPYSILEELGVVNDTFADRQIVIVWKPGTVSPLYKQVIVESKDIGSAAAFSRMLDGRLLTFARDGETIIDLETRSTWNLFGAAISGPLAGQRLTPVQSNEFFWFAWAGFRPDTALYQLSD